MYSVLKEPPPGDGENGAGGTTPPSKKGPRDAESTIPIRSRDTESVPVEDEGAHRSGSPRSQKHLPKPEELPLGEYGKPIGGDSGSKSRREADTNLGMGLGPLASPEVSYSADDIISKNSKFSHHRRPLINAEALVEKENLEGAIEIYQRTEARIPDAEIKNKLNQNISDLKSFLKKKQKLEDLYQDNGDMESDGELVDRLDKLTPQSPIPLRDLAEAIREISEALGESLQKGFYPPQAYPPGGWAGGKEDGFAKQLPPNYFPPPIVYQIVGTPPQDFQAKYQPPQGSSYPQGTSPETPGARLFSGMPEAQVGDPTAAPNLRPPPTNEAHAPLDLPEDTFFSRDWDRFKDLPLTDRRSGKERRQNKDRRTGLERKDRRSGEDRRKRDLFQEREEYLKKKAEEKKAFLDSQAFSEKPLSDQLEPFYPPSSPKIDLPAIGLPDAETKVSGPQPIFQLTPEAIELQDIGLPAPEFSTEPGEFPVHGGSLPSPPSIGLPEPWSKQEDPKPLVELFLPDPISLPLDGTRNASEMDGMSQDAGPTDAEDEQDEWENVQKVTIVDPQKESFVLPEPENARLGEDHPAFPLPEPEILPVEDDQQGVTPLLEKISPTDLNEIVLPEPETTKWPLDSDQLLGAEKDFEPMDSSLIGIGLPDPEEMRREIGEYGPELKSLKKAGDDGLEDRDIVIPDDLETPEIEIVDGDIDDQLGEIETEPERMEEEKEPEKILHGVLELKPPEVDDAPFLTLTYDFGKIPHGFRLSKNYSIMEYSYYKYKPMLMKAQEFARRKMLKNALNYYRVVKSQNIPPELRKMINRNIQDITEFLEKYLMAKGG